MKRKTLTTLTALAVANLLVAAPAMSASMNNLPAEKNQGTVTYLTGGVGADESAAIKRAESEFPLSLEFVQAARPKAEYLADVHVTIKDQTGKVLLQTVSDGPFLLAKLPDGKYTVSAENNDQTKTQHVVLAANKPEHVVFEWRK
jgi:hypothetical protein